MILESVCEYRIELLVLMVYGLEVGLRYGCIGLLEDSIEVVVYLNGESVVGKMVEDIEDESFEI